MKNHGIAIDLERDGLDHLYYVAAVRQNGLITHLVGIDTRTHRLRAATAEEISPELFVRGYDKMTAPQRHKALERFTVSLPSKRIIDIKTNPRHGTRHLDDVSNAHQAESCSMLFAIPYLCPDPAAANLIFVTSLAAPQMDLLCSEIYGSAVSVTKVTALPSMLPSLLDVFCGDSQWHEKRSDVSFPHIFEPHALLGQPDIATKLEDYATAEIHWKHQTVNVEASCANRLVALFPELPDQVSKSLFVQNPLTLPVFFGEHIPNDWKCRRLELDGNALATYDPEILAQLTAYADGISVLIIAYSTFAHDHPKDFRKAIKIAAENIVPNQRNGKFLVSSCDATTQIKKYFVANLELFLRFCIKYRGIAYDDANAFYLAVRGSILPESLPKSTKSDSPSKTSCALSLTDPHAFLQFLSEYLADHSNHIQPVGSPWAVHTVGLIRTLDSCPEPLLCPDSAVSVPNPENVQNLTDHSGGDA